MPRSTASTTNDSYAACHCSSRRSGTAAPGAGLSGLSPVGLGGFGGLAGLLVLVLCAVGVLVVQEGVSAAGGAVEG